MEMSAYMRAALPGVGELVARQRYKEALDLIKKKLKKTQDPAVLALRAQILLASGDPLASAEQCRAITARKPAVEDPDTLSNVFGVLFQLLQYPQAAVKTADLARLWQDAIAQQANVITRADYALAWASNAITLGAWSQLAQQPKAAATVQRYLPATDRTKRQYYFWQQVGNWLDSRLENASMMGMMVRRSLEMSVKNMPAEEPTSDAVQGNWISSRSEFLLLGEVFLNSDNMDTAKMIGLIGSKQLDTDARRATWGADEAKLAALWKVACASKTAEDAQASWTAARDLLRKATESGVTWKQDKYDYWAVMIASLVLLQYPTAETRETRSLLESGPQTRTKSIALLSFWTSCPPSEEASKGLLRALESHLQTFKNFSTGADDVLFAADLRHVDSRAFQQFSRQEVDASKPATIQDDKPSIEWLTAEINTLKYDYSLLSITDGAEAIDELILKALRLYKTSKAVAKTLPNTARHPGDEAALVAARALLDRASASTELQHTTLQAVVLLLGVVHFAEHNFDARSLLVSALLSLGMVSVAAQQFQKLGVKSVLFERSGPRLYTRMGSLSPMKSMEYDSAAAMKIALRWYSDGLDTAPTLQERALENTNYQQAVQIASFTSRLQHSATRQILRLESRRSGRLSGALMDESALRFASHPPRDGHENSSVFALDSADKLALSPLPSTAWLCAMKKIDAALTIASTVSTTNRDHASYSTLCSQFSQDVTDEAVQAAVTPAERDAYVIASTVGSLAIKLLGLPSVSTPSLYTLSINSSSTTEMLGDIKTKREISLERTKSVLLSTMQSRATKPFPGWRFQHEIYMFLDTDKALYRLLEHIAKQKDTSAADRKTAAALQKDIVTCRETLRAEAIDADGWLEDWWSSNKAVSFVLDESLVGRELKATLEDGGMCNDHQRQPFSVAKTLGAMLSSAKDSVNGVLRVKVV